MKRRHFLTGAAGGSLWTAAGTAGAKSLGPRDLRAPQPIGLAAPPAGEVTDAAVVDCEVRRPESIKILQLTDLHFHCDRERHGERADARTREEIRRLVERHAPDLLAFSGDVWHDPAPGQSEAIFEEALEAMTEPGVPWLFTWGNHDLLESVAPAQVALSRASKSLYRGAYSGGNYWVRLKSQGDAVGELLCLNTTTQGVQEAQEAWLRAQSPRGRASLCFLHIPLLQYATVWEAGKAHGLKEEAVCTYGEDGSALPLLQRLNVRACFCGHDHVNDYSGQVSGVELVYGRATGHAGYGGDRLRKGGKLITWNALEGSLQWQTVFADGASWTP